MASPPPLFVAQPPPGTDGRTIIRRVLIANRGEIACRVIATCRKLSITSVAVYVEEDSTSRHISDADEAISLGMIDQPGGNPYLNSDLLVRVALDASIDAIHPGYGYLSENAEFAKAIARADMKFIGPSPEAMSTLGDKRSAKAYLREHDPTIPLVPGITSSSQNHEDLVKAASRIGYPLMIKASAGGGGRGMRIVQDPSRFRDELQTAQSEAQRFFGSSDCIVEKYIDAGKHIEIQIVGDSHGNVISLGERECSIQRRHQKVIEETPSPWIDAKKRKEMGDVAAQIGQLLGYENAGTVEFVFDVKTGNFYFLEVNTRLQVEHPITEEVTRLDIVSLQLFVAAGGDLSTLDALRAISTPLGHAIECRLCAEDPQHDFRPGHGIVRLWKPPALEDSLARTVRYETAMTTGSRISIFFDSMIAKIVVWAANRELARARMIQILSQTACVGVVTNQLFLQKCLLHDNFSDPAYTTSFIPDNLTSLLHRSADSNSSKLKTALPLIGAYLLNTLARRGSGVTTSFRNIRSGFRNQTFDPISHPNRQITTCSSDSNKKQAYICSWKASSDDSVSGSTWAMPEPGSQASIASMYNLYSKAIREADLPGEESHSLSIRSVNLTTNKSPICAPWMAGTANLVLDGSRFVVHFATDSLYTGYSGRTESGEGVNIYCHLPILGTWTLLTCFSPLSYFENIREKTESAAQQGLRSITAPMPCKVLSILKADGEAVRAGDKVMVVESMKMEINISVSTDGTFRTKVAVGDALDEGKPLCVVEEVDADTSRE